MIPARYSATAFLCCAFLCCAFLGSALPLTAAEPGSNEYRTFQLGEVFDLELVTDPQIAPDGKSIVYARNFMDRMADRRRSNLWRVDVESGDHRPLTSGLQRDRSPRFSPDGERLYYVSSTADGSELFVYYFDTARSARLTQLPEGPGNLAVSPDGKWIAFSMFVPAAPKTFAKIPAAPKGAKWAPAAKVIDSLKYREDGGGYLKDGFQQLFVLSAEGGTPRQVTSGPYNHEGRLAWTPESDALVFSANRHEDWEYEPANSELHEVNLANGTIQALTDRHGPDGNPTLSPDGTKIAYTGNDERYQGYQLTRLYVLDRGGDGAQPRLLLENLDRSVRSPTWSADGKTIYFLYTHHGDIQLASVPASGGEHTVLTGGVGGTSLGRPYTGGSFSLAQDGTYAFTMARPNRPADLGVGRGTTARRLTDLNEDLFGHKELGDVEELWWKSSHDNRDVQGWIVRPPGFDASKKYPLILEIHGGPFSAYGPHFAAEIQLFAAAGYVVFYANPRGSTSYGHEFGNLIDRAYPGNDYDDLMSGIDAVLAQGYVDEENLFVTGGSGGGVLTAWIVGNTHRFRAAVSAKPVIHWTSFVLTADNYNFYYRYWFPGFPWDHQEHYWKRSPLSLVGNVKTPTMLLTGEADYRTPMSESEQYYQALRLMKVDSMLVRIPEASHGIAARPSHLMSKVAHILAWFEKYRDK